MNNLDIKVDGEYIFYNNKIAVVHYSEELKIYEAKKILDLKVVDNSDFISLYIIKIIDKNYFQTPDSLKELEICLTNSTTFLK